MTSLMQHNKLPKILLISLSLLICLPVVSLAQDSQNEGTNLSSDSSPAGTVIANIASNDIRTLLSKAEELITANKTEDAFAIYTKIMTSPDLIEQVDLAKFHYNLAINAAKSKRTGLAIAYLHKTLSTSPFDWDARHNLRILKDDAQNRSGYGQRFYSVGFLRYAIEYTPPGTFLFLSSLAILIILLNALVIRRRLIFVLALLFLIPAGSIAAFVTIEGQNELGVVIAKSPPLRSGPNDSFPEILQIGEGSEVSLIEKRKDWYKVEFSLVANPDEAIVGWIHEKDLLSL